MLAQETMALHKMALLLGEWVNEARETGSSCE